MASETINGVTVISKNYVSSGGISAQIFNAKAVNQVAYDYDQAAETSATAGWVNVKPYKIKVIEVDVLAVSDGVLTVRLWGRIGESGTGVQLAPDKTFAAAGQWLVNIIEAVDYVRLGEFTTGTTGTISAVLKATTGGD